MVFFTRSFHYSPTISSKLENHNHHQHHHEFQAISASLHSFRSHVSDSLNQLLLNLKPGSESLSLSWIQQSLELISTLTKAFAKLVMDIQYPMSKWEVSSKEEYLSYTLKLLDFLNSISSLLSQLGQARVSISHALTLIDSSPQSTVERLGGAIQLHTQISKDLMKVEEEKGESEEEVILNDSGKQLVFHEGLMEMKRIGNWVCGVVLFGLSGDIEPYSVMKRGRTGFPVACLEALDLEKFSEEKLVVLKELREVKEAAAGLAEAVGDGKSGGAAAAAKNLGRRLEVVEKVVEGTGKEADGIFSEVLARRNELLDVFRQHEY